MRTIYLPQETINLLLQEHAKHSSNPIMFPSPVTGRLYGPDCIGRLHKNLLKKAGIAENIPFHGLRHTFVTLAIQQGVDAKTVSSILGHYSAGFSLDTYTHVTREMQKDAAQRMLSCPFGAECSGPGLFPGISAPMLPSAPRIVWVTVWVMDQLDLSRCRIDSKIVASPADRSIQPPASAASPSPAAHGAVLPDTPC